MIRKLLLLLTLTLQIGINAQDAALQWGVSYGGARQYADVLSRTDAQGNVYISSYFGGSIDLDPGPAIDLHTAPAGEVSLFIQKFDPDGILVWAKDIPYTLPQELTIDKQGNVVMMGRFNKPSGTSLVDFDPGPSSTFLDWDQGKYFILKLGTQGDFQWVSQMNGYMVLGDILTDSQDSIVVAGYTSASANFQIGSPIGYYNNLNSKTGYIYKMTPGGQLSWVKLIDGPKVEIDAAVIATNGAITLSGIYEGTVDFDPGTDTVYRTSKGTNSNDIFILHLSSMGDFQWVHTFGTQSYDIAYELAIDPSDNIYFLGKKAGSNLNVAVNPPPAVILPANKNYYMIKMSQTGALLDAITFDHFLDDAQLEVDSSGNLYMGGTLNSYALYVRKFSATYSPLWTKTVDSFKGQEKMGSLSLSGSDLIISGIYDGDSIDLDFNTGVDMHPSHSARNFMLLKIKPCTPTADSVVLKVCTPFELPSGKAIIKKSGIYKDTIANVSGCDSVITFNLDISIDPTIQLFAPWIVAVQDSATYQWLDCLNSYIPIVGATGRSYAPAVAGAFAVEITRDSCVDTSACFSIQNIGLAEIDNNYVISLYPNPTTGLVYLNSDPKEIISIVVLDITGRMVKRTQAQSTINLSTLENGTYIIRVETKEGVTMEKVIKK